MGLSVGIDLGTTFSAIAVVNQTGHAIVVKNKEGNPVTPSVIAFNVKELVVGDEAKELQALGEANIASFFKRSIGNNNFILQFNRQTYTPTDLSALILKKLKVDQLTRDNFEELTRDLMERTQSLTKHVLRHSHFKWLDITGVLLVYGSNHQLLVALYDQDGKRAIMDGGFTRLFCNWDTAGTGRYVKNAAGWLVNFERFSR